MNGFSYVDGAQGDIAGIAAIEIKAIPNYALISATEAEAKNAVRDRFSGLLSEIGLRYRRGANSGGVSVCVDSLWISTPSEGQVNAAKISLFLVFHAMGDSRPAIESVLSQCVSSTEHLLTSLYFEHTRAAYDDVLAPLISLVSDEALTSLTRAPRITPIGNQYIQYCLDYDAFPLGPASLDTLMQSLGNHPGALISLQITPTQFAQDEHAALTNYSQLLTMASNGNQMPGMDVLATPSAKGPAETYSFYLNSANGALFTYAFFICGSFQAVSDMSGTLNASVGYHNGKQTSFTRYAIEPNEVYVHDNLHFLPWAIGELTESLYSDDLARAGVLNDQAIAPCVWLPGVITADEAAGFMRTPVGIDSIAAIYRILDSANVAHEFREGVLNDSDIIVGTLKSSRNHEIGFNLKDLTRHMLVVGTPGSGKTTFSVGLLDRLWKNFGIPFLVIEPAKNEYRALVQSIPDLQVFTPGKSNISPFVMNPFLPPKGVRLETYKATLLTVFSAGVSMESPLDRLFEQAVDECYSQFGWLDSYTIDDGGRIFNIDDFVLVFRQVMEKIGYVGDASNIVRAGLVRLQRMRKLFDTYQSIPIQDLLNKPTVIELAAIENSDEKALLIALVLLLIQTYVTTNYVGRGELRNVILLEEAHVLLGDGSDGSPSAANPSKVAQNLLKRMLAEIRSAGVGIVVADQSPRKVTQDVVGLTDIKLAFRLVELEDRNILANATTMNETQQRRLAGLQIGEGFLYYQKLDHPEEVQTPDYRLDNAIDVTLDDNSIAELTTYWSKNPDLLKPYPVCLKSSSCSNGCNVRCRELSANAARELFSQHFEGLEEEVRITSQMVLDIVKQHLASDAKTKTALEANAASKQQLGYCTQVQLYRKIRYDAQKKIFRS